METEITHYKARWIYPVDSPPIENGIVAVSQGKIAFVGEARKAQDLVDLGEGVLLPALINAHTHLDLSALKGLLDSGIGFLPWVKSLLVLRESLTDDKRRSAIERAVKELHQYGTIAVGDWTGSLGMDGFDNLNGLIRCAFFEIIGFSDQTLTLPASLTSNSELRTPNSELSDPDSAIRNPQSAVEWFSLGAHAPHTTSPALLKAAKSWTSDHGLPLSIHVAESKEEEEFLFTGQGPWREFLMERQKWSDNWTSPRVSPVAYLDSLGLFDDKTQCIHLTRAEEKDLQRLKERRVRIVVCPRSNQFITGSLPRLTEMLQIGLSPALGTDSLASNHDLNLWEEMAFVHQAFPEIAPKQILQMATLNGARSINLEKKLGSLSPGKQAAALFLPLDPCTIMDLPEAIIGSKGKNLRWIGEEGCDE